LAGQRKPHNKKERKERAKGLERHHPKPQKKPIGAGAKRARSGRTAVRTRRERGAPACLKKPAGSALAQGCCLRFLPATSSQALTRFAEDCELCASFQAPRRSAARPTSSSFRVKKFST